MFLLGTILPMFAFSAGVQYISEPEYDGSHTTYQVQCTDGRWAFVLVTNGVVYSWGKGSANNIGVSEAARRACN